MAVLCPMALWNTYYLINHLHSSGSRQEYVTITVATASSTGVRMTSAGGVTSLVTGWTTFDSSIFSMDHVTVRVTGVTSLWHASGKRFQVLQSAFAKDWGYTFSAGCDLGFGSPTTTTAATTLSSSPSVSTSPPTSTSTTAPSSSSPSSTATSTTPQSTHTTTPTSTVTMTSSTTTKISPPTSSASSVTVSNVSSVTAPHHPSNSPSLSWLPAWLDEESEWVVAGAAAGGVVVVAVVTLAVLVTIRKHQRTVAASALTARSSGTVTMVTRKHVTASAAHSVPVTTVKQTSLGGEGAKWGVVSASNTLRLQFKPRLVRRFSRGYMAHGVNMTPVETV
ncbi:uncharacterized protein [Littorina saxatilis]|uniref:uncharacterized protein n=1 Tax=Littorina saxatilis TaxID=31220 RepID=UPI0038B54CF2